MQLAEQNARYGELSEKYENDRYPINYDKCLR